MTFMNATAGRCCIRSFFLPVEAYPGARAVWQHSRTNLQPYHVPTDSIDHPESSQQHSAHGGHTPPYPTRFLVGSESQPLQVSIAPRLCPLQTCSGWHLETHGVQSRFELWAAASSCLDGFPLYSTLRPLQNEVRRDHRELLMWLPCRKSAATNRNRMTHPPPSRWFFGGKASRK